MVFMQMNTAANLKFCCSGLEDHPSAARTECALASVLGPCSCNLRPNFLAGACAVNIVIAGVLCNGCLNSVSSVSTGLVCF